MAPAAPTLVLQELASGLPNPVGVVVAGDGSSRLFIVLQGGRIVIWDGTEVLPTDFLNITTLVSCCGERGLLGLTFHPNYASNGFFYVNYVDKSNNTVIARYEVSGNPNVADASSRQVILSVPQPAHLNHKGGQINFGPDGYLYIALGDGGGAGDPDNRAQNLNDLLGKLLRIDVNGAFPYAIPPTKHHRRPGRNLGLRPAQSLEIHLRPRYG
jgi:glucose/arabinose dehydrogenase